jgi:hypothetical protein
MGVADRLHSAAIHLLRYARKQDVLSREGPARLSAIGDSGAGKASDDEPNRRRLKAIGPGPD